MFCGLSLLMLYGCSTLSGRLQENLARVDYADGVDMVEATYIAQYFRLNNLKWFALSGPSDSGDYWKFKVIQAGTGELLDIPPVLIHKRAYSLKSATRFDKNTY